MADIWFISDTHLGHENILKFTRNDGTPLRRFSSLEEMHHTILSNWNSVVKPQDKVYHLGDVAFRDWALRLLKNANGHKRLILGNHDRFKMSMYQEVFEKIYGVGRVDRLWLTHVPMHVDSVAPDNCVGNVHGHLHYRTIDHSKYLNVSVECIDYRPIHLDQVLSLLGKYK